MRDVYWSGHRTQQDILRWKLKELRDLQEAKTFQPDKVEEHLPEDLNPNATQDRTLQVQAQRTLEEKETGEGAEHPEDYRGETGGGCAFTHTKTQWTLLIMDLVKVHKC